MRAAVLLATMLLLVPTTAAAGGAFSCGALAPFETVCRAAPFPWPEQAALTLDHLGFVGTLVARVGVVGVGVVYTVTCVGPGLEVGNPLKAACTIQGAPPWPGASAFLECLAGPHPLGPGPAGPFACGVTAA